MKQKSTQNPTSGRRSAGMKAQSREKTTHFSHSDARSKVKGRGREGGAAWIWGLHAVRAALANPKRRIYEIWITQTGYDKYDGPDFALTPIIAQPVEFERKLGPGVAHQGIAAKVAPLDGPAIEDVAIIKTEDRQNIILILDQITDPHNVGAIIRLASAFHVRAVVMQSRHAPPLSGALAKVAVGCLESVPICLVTNISQTLQSLKQSGWVVSGLAGESELGVRDVLSQSDHHAIVLGAEGAGLRLLVRKRCDHLLKIPLLSRPVAGEAESLNVSTAAAIALYEVRRNLG